MIFYNDNTNNDININNNDINNDNNDNNDNNNNNNNAVCCFGIMSECPHETVMIMKLHWTCRDLPVDYIMSSVTSYPFHVNTQT